MSMKRIGWMLALAGLAGWATMTSARADAAPTDDRIQDLEQKVQALEKKLDAAPAGDRATAKEPDRDAPSISAGADGFGWTSADAAFSLKLHGFAQSDAKFFLDDDAESFSDSFSLRRARIIVDGQLGEKIFFRLAPEYSGSSTQLQDAYMDFKASKRFALRFGRTKIPLGLERLQSPADTLFNEPGLPTALTPAYNAGVLLYGALLAGKVEYALGVFNGGADGTSVDSDSNDEKDLAARIWLKPFVDCDAPALAGLALGVAGTYGKQSGSTSAAGLPVYKSSGQNTFFSYVTGSTNSSANAYADGNRTRIAPQFYYAAGPIGILGEYIVSEQDVSTGSGSASLEHEAWQTAVSWVLTGETPSLAGVKPEKPFNFGQGTWGAVELKARIGELTIDDAAFSGGYAKRTSSAKSAEAVGAGINWHLSKNAKLSLDYEQTAFEGGAATGDRPDEKVIIARAQVKF